ncbi:hypothetical protein D3C76_924920 [compost metagenome]
MLATARTCAPEQDAVEGVEQSAPLLCLGQGGVVGRVGRRTAVEALEGGFAILAGLVSAVKH